MGSERDLLPFQWKVIPILNSDGISLEYTINLLLVGVQTLGHSSILRNSCYSPFTVFTAALPATWSYRELQLPPLCCMSLHSEVAWCRCTGKNIEGDVSLLVLHLVPSQDLWGAQRLEDGSAPLKAVFASYSCFLYIPGLSFVSAAGRMYLFYGNKTSVQFQSFTPTVSYPDDLQNHIL